MISFHRRQVRSAQSDDQKKRKSEEKSKGNKYIMTFLVVVYAIHGSGIFALRHWQMYVCVQQTLPSMCIYTFDLTNVISTPQDTNAKTREEHLDLHPTQGGSRRVGLK